MTHALPRRRRRLAGLAASLSVAAIAGFGFLAPAPAIAAEDTVVARVNGAEITRGDLEAMKARMGEQIPQLGMLPLEAVYEGLLDRAIDQVLLTRAGEDAGLADSPAVQRQLEEIRRELVQRAYLSSAVEDRLTDERLREHYGEVIAEQPAEEEVKARHILLESEEDARAVIAELDKGADFAEVAKERSTGPSGPNGGDLGWFTQGTMVPEFAEAAFAMEPGSVSSDPVQTQFGWHVIKVEERRTAEPPTFEEARDDLRASLAEEIVAEVLESLREGAEVQTFGLDGKPAAQ